MLSPSIKISVAFLSLSCLISTARASEPGGFSEVNPYSRAEKILDQDVAPKHIVNYRDKMRDNVIMLGDYAKAHREDFLIVVHASDELLKKEIWEYDLSGYNRARKTKRNAWDPTFLVKPEDFKPEQVFQAKVDRYVKTIDGIVYNNYFCGNGKINKISGLPAFSIDRCRTEKDLDEAIQQSVGSSVPMYAFTDVENAFKSARHQMIINENAKNVYNLQEAQNILFLTDNSAYKDKFSFIEELRDTNFDVIVVPAFVNGEALTKDDVRDLKFKKNGTLRKVLAVINVSEADPQEYYWQQGWKIGRPEWLKRASFANKNNIITQYWHQEWKKIISKYFKGIVDLEFDGAFLTGLENYRYFEQQTPLD